MSAPLALHASAVAVGDRGLLILGSSGSGKSSLAIEMIALGAALISDDIVWAAAQGGRIMLSAPTNAPALIEARGMGLLRTPLASGPVAASYIVDLDRPPGARLPEAEDQVIEGVAVPLLTTPPIAAAAALYLALRDGGPIDPDA